MHSAYLVLVLSIISSVTCGEHKQRQRARVDDQLLPVTSVVADIRQSTNIADRERSLKEIAEPIIVPKTAAVTVTNIPNLEDDVKSDVQPVKRNNIEHPLIHDADDTDDDTTAALSGSGDDAAASKLVEESPKSAKESSSASKKQLSKKCHQRCSMPMTFEQCALPRCSYKIRPIRTLCFSLCRNQKKRCVEVCE